MRAGRRTLSPVRALFAWIGTHGCALKVADKIGTTNFRITIYKEARVLHETSTTNMESAANLCYGKTSASPGTIGARYGTIGENSATATPRNLASTQDNNGCSPYINGLRNQGSFEPCRGYRLKTSR